MTKETGTMMRKTTTAPSREGGFALIGVLLVGVLLMGIGAALHETVISETVLRGTHAHSVSGFYTAEAGINRAMGEYRNIFLSYNQPSGTDFDPHTFALGNRDVNYKLQSICDPPNPTSSCPEQVRVPAGRAYSGLIAQQYKYTASAESETLAGDIESSLGTEFQINYIPMFQFLAFYQNDLEILPGANMYLHGPIHTNGNLYLNSNATLRIEDDPPTQPTVNVTAHGHIFRGRKNDTSCGGTVEISKLADAPASGQLPTLGMGCNGGSRKQFSSDELSAWLGSIKHEQAFVAIPEPDVIDRGTGEFWGFADLRLSLEVGNPDGDLLPIVVLDASDNVDATLTQRLRTFMSAKPGRIFYNDVPNSWEANTGYCSSPTEPSADDRYCHFGSYEPVWGNPANELQGDLYACVETDLGLYPGCPTYMKTIPLPSGGVTARRGGFYNNRENQWVYMLNVNVHDLLAWNRAQASSDRLFDPDDQTEGGIVLFLTVRGPNSDTVATPRYGVRVFGSPNFDFPPSADPTGVTVVSDQAVYVEGHYNVGPAATGIYDASHPKQPAALMGDAINVLSSNWSGDPSGWGNCRNDCQSRKSLNSPTERWASTTYVNAAFLGGSDQTTLNVSSSYGGGFENYPRFHEKWSGRTLMYRGSIVSLGESQRNNGSWCGTGGSLSSGCNIYDPPGRDWDYDLDFQEVRNLPPLTPRVISVEQILFTENFR